MSTLLESMAAKATLNSVGAAGSIAITGTGAVSAPAGYYIYCISFVADTVVASDVDLAGATNANLASFTLFPAGFNVFGKFTTVTLTSGQAIGYLALL